MSKQRWPEYDRDLAIGDALSQLRDIFRNDKYDRDELMERAARSVLEELARKWEATR